MSLTRQAYAGVNLIGFFRCVARLLVTSAVFFVPAPAAGRTGILVTQQTVDWISAGEKLDSDYNSASTESVLLCRLLRRHR